MNGSALLACAEGRLAPALALMQLCLAAPDAASVAHAIESALTQAPPVARERLEAVKQIWDETPGAFALVTRVGSSSAGQDIEDWRKLFDQAVAVSPEASVALYSLGRPDLLAAATQELVEFLTTRELLQPDTGVLEIGCGIGRIVGAIAPRVRAVTGLDISRAMLGEARRRVPAASVSFVQGNGRDLSPFAEGSFDLALGVDVFPYLVAAGLDVAEANLREARRVLRPGGRLLIFNFSYRGDDESDRADVARLAQAVGMPVLVHGERPLKSWDGLFFDLGRS